jgi:glycine/D-amino acid oxidase-like deaminating enzyme
MAAWGPGLSLRKRLDGGYTVSQGSVVAGIVPDSFRYFREFLPALRMEWKGLSLRLDGSFLQELKQGNSWKLDDISPFERSRVLDPAPSEKNIRLAYDNLVKTFPVFKSTSVVQSWAGLIDTTPDTLPVISPTEALPGLYLSTGYSGHGFGIGLGAGRLTAELVTGRSPVVDPHPFRLSRFTDGSVVRPQAGL